MDKEREQILHEFEIMVPALKGYNMKCYLNNVECSVGGWHWPGPKSHERGRPWGDDISEQKAGP